MGATTAVKTVFNAIPFGSILYSGSQYVANSVSEVAAMGAQQLSSGFRTLDSMLPMNLTLENLSNRTFSYIGNATQYMEQQATDALNVPKGSQFTASELVGPVALTFGLGLLAARSALLVTKHAKMLFCCERIEVLERRTASGPGVKIRDSVDRAYTGTGLFISTVANGVLIPIFIYLGKETQNVIVDQLKEVGISIIPAEYIMIAGIASYITFRTIKYLNAN